MHREWDDLAVSEHERLNLQVHRDGAKSTFWAITYPLWRINLWRWLRKQGRPEVDEHIGILGVNKDEAEARLRQVKRELEGNTRLAQDFGPAVPGEEWTESDITLAEAEDVKSPTLYARSLYSAEPGMRSTAIIVDDSTHPAHVHAKMQRDKQELQLDEVVIPNLLEGAPLILTHTTYHSDDLPNRKARDSSYIAKKWPLVQDFDRKLVSWPERFPWPRVETLMRKPLIFARQYQLRDEPPEGRLLPIPKTWPREALEMRDGQWRIFGQPIRTAVGVDPATKARETQEGSRTAIVTIGYLPNWDGFVLEVRCGRWDPDKTWQEIIEVWKTWHPLQVFIEEVAFSAVFAKMLAKQTPVPAQGVPAKGDKQERITGALNPYFHSGKIKLLEKGDPATLNPRWKDDQTEEAHREIAEFPGDTMDICDAMAICHSNAITSRAYATRPSNKLIRNVRGVLGGGSGGWITTGYGD
jgi:hypothetical protein